MRRVLSFNIGPGPDPEAIHGGWATPCWYWSLAHFLEMNGRSDALMVDLFDNLERLNDDRGRVPARTTPDG